MKTTIKARMSKEKVRMLRDKWEYRLWDEWLDSWNRNKDDVDAQLGLLHSGLPKFGFNLKGWNVHAFVGAGDEPVYFEVERINDYVRRIAFYLELADSSYSFIGDLQARDVMKDKLSRKALKVLVDNFFSPCISYLPKGTDINSAFSGNNFDHVLGFLLYTSSP
jgi:hypothetical protein